MRTVGLTGGIATGKSTVAGLLRARGVPVLDADQVARDVVAPGSPVLDQIRERFGSDALTAHGTLDRAAMRARIAQDPQARRDLEAITHPAIFTGLQAGLQALGDAGHPLAVVEAALMVETGSYRLYDALVVVTCDPATQLRRLLARDGQDEAVARGLLAAQLPLADKEAVADVVIRNDGDLDALKAAVEVAWQEIVGGDGDR